MHLAQNLAPRLCSAKDSIHVVVCVIRCPRSFQLQSQWPHPAGKRQEAVSVCGDRSDDPYFCPAASLSACAKVKGTVFLLPHL